MSDDNVKILLLDSNSLLHRAYHALPLLKTSKGFYTGAIYGFLTILLRLIKEQQPTHIAAAFDVHGGTFRHDMYAEYKANRKPMDEELHMQVEPLKELLKMMNIKVVTKQGYEGDDILGTLAKRFDKDTVIVSGDRDIFQLVDSTTKIFWTKKGVSDIQIVDVDYLKNEGFTPDTYIDFKALRGDTSDNIPGVSGVGDKTAKDLLDKFGNLDGVLAHADEVKGKLGETLRSSEDIARLSRKLCEICTSAPVECTLDEMAFAPVFDQKVRQRLNELEMPSLANRMTFDGEAQSEPVKREIQKAIKEIKSVDEIKNAIGNAQRVAVCFKDDIYFAISANEEYHVNCVQDLFSDGVSFDDAAAEVIALAKSRELVCYDVKSLMKRFDFECGKFFDVMIAAHIAREGASIKSAAALFGSEGLEEGAAETIALADELKKQLYDKGLTSLFYDVEQPLALVLKRMEERGFAVNLETLEKLGAKYGEKLDDLSKQIYEAAGETFNIASPKQLGEVLFDKMQLAHGKKNKTGYSVDEDTLIKLGADNPFVALILEWRHFQKLQSTYIKGLEPLVNRGRIHTDFKQCITATGRLSSTNPNLQNIPVRGEEAKDVKSAFRASEGNVLVSADYSQIELRLLAHMSEDEVLIQSYADEKDIHAATAAEIFHVSESEVTHDMRRDAKAVNFGIVYGMSDFGLAESIGVPKYKAKEYIEHYFATHPKVREYLDNAIESARETGYAETLLGRRRALPELKSSVYLVRSGAERMAMNTPLQGSAADIVKLAMLKVEKRLEGMKSKMILQVHDELIIDTAEDEKEQVIAILHEEMEHAAKLKVPLEIGVSVGTDWGQLK